MGMLGKVLQLFGLVIVPMAILFYWTNQDRLSEAKLMFGELCILSLGALCFLAGRSLDRR